MEPLAWVLWFHSHFDIVMTEFIIISKRTDAYKTDFNLSSCSREMYIICSEFDNSELVKQARLKQFYSYNHDEWNKINKKTTQSGL